MTFHTDFPSRRTVLAAALASTLAIALPAHAQSAAAAPVAGGTLTYAVFQEPASLVSLLDTKTDTRNISAKITEGLLRYDAQFNPQPLLATAWQVSADGLRYTFKLREGVKFHDGKPFTSADVRYSVLTQQKQGPRGKITLANVERVDTPDALTAVIVLKKPAPYLIKSFSSAELPIVPAHVYGDGDALASPNTTRPIGTGPFVFEQWVRGSHVVLRKNPDYWRAGHPYLDRVIYRFIADAQSLAAAVETGEVDAGLNVGLADLDRLAKNPALRIDDTYDAFLNNASFLEYNVENPILAKPEVRHAIARAIDRRFITEKVLYGRAQVINSPIPSVLSAYYDDSTFNYPYSVDEANRLLDQAGYPRGAGGTRFDLRLTLIPGADWRRISDYVRAALSRVGIRVTVLDGDLGTFLKRVYTAREFDLNLNGLGRLFDPTVGVQRIYWGEGAKTPSPWINASHYLNPNVDALFSQAAVETDEGRRATQFKEIQRTVGRDLPVLPIATVPSALQVYNRRVHQLNNSIDLTAGDFADTWVEAKK